MSQWPDDMCGNAKLRWRSKNKIQHPQPCGCIIVTVEAHVVDMTFCAEHQAIWDKKSQAYIDYVDQLIEDNIFGKESSND